MPFHPLTFGLAPPCGVQMRTVMKFAHDELDKRRFGIHCQNDETSSNVLAAALEQLELHGLGMVAARPASAATRMSRRRCGGCGRPTWT